LAALFSSATDNFAQSRDPKIAYVYPAGGQRGTKVEVLICGRLIVKPVEAYISGKGVKAKIIKSVGGIIINDQAANKVARDIYDDAKKQFEIDASEFKQKKENEIENKEKEKKELHNENSNSTDKKIDDKKIDSKKTDDKKTDSKKIDDKKTGNKKIDDKKTDDKKGGVKNVGENKLAEVFPSREEVMRKYLYFDRLLEPSADDLQFIFYEYFSPRPNKRPIDGMSQGVLIEVTIDADAEVGERELRLFTSSGMTKPVRFIVSDVREVCEFEPNDFDGAPREQFAAMGRVRPEILPRQMRNLEVQELPVIFNGRIRNGDVDRFSFRVESGSKLVIGVCARELNPYLADAVPGWFQAAVTLFDPSGKKVASASSYRFNPDPAIIFESSESGVYSVEIQDSLFRGRDDFVYRLSAGDSAVVTSIFPLGGKSGTATTAKIDGLNLPAKTMRLDTDKKKLGVQTVKSLHKKQLLFPVNYVVDDLPEVLEAESNNNIKTAQKIQTPVAINGRIDLRDDVDYFSFDGVAGELVALDVMALSLGSPLDLCLEIYNSAGKLLASNDDRAGNDGLNIGLATHHADPYLEFSVPDSGVYFVKLFNIRQEGGKEFAYRFNVTNKRSRVIVYTDSSALNFQGVTQPVKFHLERRGGFKGEVEVKIADGQNKDYILDGAIFKSDTKEATGTLSVINPAGAGKYFPLNFNAEFVNDDGIIEIAPVIAADDYEQAFIYHHLVPAKGTFIVKPRNWQIQASLAFAIKDIIGEERENLFCVTINQGKRKEIYLPFDKNNKNNSDKKNTTEKTEKKEQKKQQKQKPITPQIDLNKLSFTLANAPEGISLEKYILDKNGLKLIFAATESAKICQLENIIININLQQDKNKKTTQPLGTLPIIKCNVKNKN
jgi:hypothetical protein